MAQRKKLTKAFAAGAALLGLVSWALPAAAKDDGKQKDAGKVKHLVVIYEENHSFDNLYGTWGSVNGQAVNGIPQADLAHTLQVAQDGTTYSCLKQNDSHLTSPPLSVLCTDPNPAVGSSHFVNTPYELDPYIANTAKTEDLVHRFYQEQYQIDGGRQDRYVTGSDAVGLSMGYWDSTQLPIYAYLHGATAPKYQIADNFFQGGFGGSFLNHQVLVAAQAPIYAGADKSGVTTGCSSGSTKCDLHSVVDSNGFPNTYPLYTPTGSVKDQALTEASDANGACVPTYPGGPAPAGTLCGDYAINTIQPYTQPYAPNAAIGRRLPLLSSDNIGDHLSDRKVSWAWYSGGWDNAAGNNGRDAMHPLGAGWTDGPTNTNSGACTPPAGQTVASGAVFPNCPDSLFQFHHQPFGYFANYADGTQGRVDHLKDEQQFLQDAQSGELPAVSFVKPIGAENEHPGYTDESSGSQHLVDLINAIVNGPNGKNTLIVVTYDEFGGSWDHVPVAGSAENPGPHDVFGPGTRIPALIVSPTLKSSGVDHTQYDTTSILATIEHLWHVEPLRDGAGGQLRDSQVNALLED